MHKKANTWATSIIAGGVQQNKAWKYLNCIIPQTTKYPLHAMMLNEKQCKQTMPPIVKSGPSKAGISSKLYTSVRYRPRHLGGIVPFDLFIIHVAGRIASIAKH